MPRTVVVKFGGSAFAPAALEPFTRRVKALRDVGDRVVIVHGGGKEITRLLERLGKPSVFRHGLRVTDDETLEATELVLSGRVNKALARALHAGGVPAAGVSGTDAGLLHAVPPADAAYGHVGDVDDVDPTVLNALLAAGLVPVVSPLALGGPAGVLNVNADTAAAAIAGALGADEFLLITDVAGVLVPGPQATVVAERLAWQDVERLKAEGVITGGMVPKVDACLAAIERGAASSRILHADAFHAGLDAPGTTIHRG